LLGTVVSQTITDGITSKRCCFWKIKRIW
jgi:hypothetical protein